MPLDRNLHPKPFCRCAPCRGGRMRVWRSLSPAARRALDLLDTRVPRHPDDLRRNRGVRWPTIQRLTVANALHPQLVECVPLVEAGRRDAARPIAFYRLTQTAAQIRAAARSTSQQKGDHHG